MLLSDPGVVEYHTRNPTRSANFDKEFARASTTAPANGHQPPVCTTNNELADGMPRQHILTDAVHALKYLYAGLSVCQSEIDHD